VHEVDLAAELLASSRSCVALTGAGISTESGIPDFRGPQGVWTKDPEAARLSSIEAYLSDPDVRRRAWQLRLEHPAWTAEPNDGHLALAELQALGVVSMLVTQNIDGLHLKAGSPIEQTVEIHGSIAEVVCLSCADRGPMTAALARVRDGEDDPRCTRCGGLLKSATVSFGQNLDPSDVERSVAAARSCDLFLAVGTSLTVYPVAGLPSLAIESGARLVVINAEPTPFDDRADVVIRTPAGRTLTTIVAKARPLLSG
jgi:NAD-dependent deacetylase